MAEKETNQIIKITLVAGLILLMGAALYIDGEFGERVFGMLMASFGVVVGYFFHKASH